MLEWFRSHYQRLPVCKADLKKEQASHATDLRLAKDELAACDEQVNTLEQTIATVPPPPSTWRWVSVAAGAALALIGGSVAAVTSDRTELSVPAGIVGAGGLVLMIVGLIDP